MAAEAKHFFYHWEVRVVHEWLDQPNKRLQSTKYKQNYRLDLG